MNSSVNSESYQIGYYVKDKGVYQGLIQIPTKFDIKLPEMRLWSAPADVDQAFIDQDLNTYGRRRDYFTGVVPYLGLIKGWHGRDVIDLEDRTEDEPDTCYEERLYQYFSSLALCESKVGWVIPTIEILRGKSDNTQYMPLANSLFRNKDEIKDGAPLVVRPSGASNKTNSYLSCTETKDFPGILSASFLEGKIHGCPNNGSYGINFITRLVCLEPTVTY